MISRPISFYSGSSLSFKVPAVTPARFAGETERPTQSEPPFQFSLATLVKIPVLIGALIAGFQSNFQSWYRTTELETKRVQLINTADTVSETYQFEVKPNDPGHYQYTLNWLHNFLEDVAVDRGEIDPQFAQANELYQNALNRTPHPRLAYDRSLKFIATHPALSNPKQDLADSQKTKLYQEYLNLLAKPFPDLESYKAETIANAGIHRDYYLSHSEQDWAFWYQVHQVEYAAPPIPKTEFDFLVDAYQFYRQSQIAPPHTKDDVALLAQNYIDTVLAKHTDLLPNGEQSLALLSEKVRQGIEQGSDAQLKAATQEAWLKGATSVAIGLALLWWMAQPGLLPLSSKKFET